MKRITMAGLLFAGVTLFGGGQVQHCGGHMLKWYRCKYCDGYGSVKRKDRGEQSNE